MVVATVYLLGLRNRRREQRKQSSGGELAEGRGWPFLRHDNTSSGQATLAMKQQSLPSYNVREVPVEELEAVTPPAHSFANQHER